MRKPTPANALQTNEADAKALFKEKNPRLEWANQSQSVRNVWRMKAFALATNPK